MITASVIHKANGNPVPGAMLRLGLREALRARFDVGTWEALRICYATSCTSASADDVAPPSETLPSGSLAANFFTIGIKDNSNLLPGVVGARFAGLGQPNAATNSRYALLSASGYIFDATPTAIVDNTFVAPSIGTKVSPGILLQSSLSNQVSAGWTARVNTLEFVVTNRGASNQTLQVRSPGDSAGVSTADLSAANIRAIGGTISVSSSYMVTFPWVANGVALPLPDTFYMRLPFSTVRLRVHGFVIERLQ